MIDEICEIVATSEDLAADCAGVVALVTLLVAGLYLPVVF